MELKENQSLTLVIEENGEFVEWVYSCTNLDELLLFLNNSKKTNY